MQIITQKLEKTLLIIKLVAHHELSLKTGLMLLGFRQNPFSQMTESTLKRRMKMISFTLTMMICGGGLIAQTPCSTDCNGTNTFVGNNAGAVTTGTSNTFVGNSSGSNNTSGGGNTYVGASAGLFNNTGASNSYFGASAGTSNNTGSNNSFFGNSAGFTNRASNNSFFGASAGTANTTGTSNSFFGREAGNSNVTGESNSFFGDQSGSSNTTGNFNTFFGTSTGTTNTTGTSNSFFGRDAGRSNLAGSSNSFFGIASGFSNTNGTANSFFGRESGFMNTQGTSNSFFGNLSGRLTVAGTDNSFFGSNAGRNNINGSRNLAIGAGSGPTASNPDANNRLYIDINLGNSGNDNPLIYGEFDNDFVRINGTFEVTAGLTNPSSILFKERLTTVTPSLVLDKINDLDIVEWSYKHDPEVRHIGPIAEEFYEAFGLGTGSDNISTIDADGVSLIAIQALSEQLTQQEENHREEMDQKDLEIATLQERLVRIEALLLKME